MWRLFLAVVPPLELREELQAVIGSLAPRLPGRWLSAEQLHLTLAFLGDCPPASIESIREAADGAASSMPPFELVLGDLGAFSSLRRARVAFLRVDSGAGHLGGLARAFSEALPSELRPDGLREFRAHLTLARFREPPPEAMLCAVGEALGRRRPRRFLATSIELLRSELRPSGAVYSTVHSAPLDAEADPR